MTRFAFSTISFLVSSCLISLPLLGGPSPIQPLDLFEFEYVLDPQISPDGQQIVYLRRYSDVLTDKRYSNLWLIHSDGSDHRPLTTGKFHDGSPKWSPDGKKLLYVSDRDDKPQLYVRWIETGEVAQVTNLVHAPQQPVWSPDGKWIAFVSFVPEDPQVIGTRPSPPSGAAWAAPSVVVDRYIFRFDGAGYLNQGYAHLFVIPAEGGTPRQVSSGSFHHSGPWVHASPPVWTPDGKHLLISTNRHEDYEFDPLNTEIYEYSVADGSVRSLTQRKGADEQPTVSPDGSLIAYTGFDDRDLSYHTRRLYVMNRDGSGVRGLSEKLDRSVSAPRWTSDGRGILCLFSDHGINKIVHFSLAGSMKVIADQVGTGGWAFGYGASYSLSNSGVVAFPYTTSTVPGDLAVVKVNEPETKLLTELNDEILSHRLLGEVEELWFSSSLDGRKIQGWVIKPPNFDPSNKYPLILEIHGGPFASFGGLFAFDLQLYAAQGYVVLYTNPRGSTSYGEEFANLIHRALKLLGVDTVLVRVPDEPHGTAVRPSHLMDRLLTVTGWFDRYKMNVGTEGE